MKRLILTAPVDVQGPNLFNQTSHLRLEPVDKPGWYWQVDGIDVPIGPEVADRRMRRLRLVSGRRVLESPEHIIALREMGLDAVRVIASRRWPPHDGSAATLFGAVVPKLASEGTLRNVRIKNSIRCDTADNQQLSELLPSPTDYLKVDVRIDYAGVGAWALQKRFRGGLDEEVCRAQTISILPTPLWWILKHLPSSIWPHYHRTFWNRDPRPPRMLQQIALHRVLDILGAAALMHPAGTALVGTLVSRCGGHTTDMGLVEMIKVGGTKLIDAT